VTQMTSGLSTYADGGQGTYHPSWSPDGGQILFSHGPATDGFADLFVMKADGSDAHAIADTMLHENHAEWGPDPSP
jgi:Tol biopolymer transport system component